MAEDVVNKPKHYKSPFGIPIEMDHIEKSDPGSTYGLHFIQALDVIKAWGLQRDFYLGNVIKYILRAGKKDDAKYLEDLKKARFYLDARITEMEEVSNGKNSGM